ncbi:endonuclease domain-containing protein [Alkanindiges illinoisensis]|uniref:endonuclease domain-containing protein n=1 Tax=Alkanindiges illinoisensis TaxID=197183 RepID=UPI00047CA4C2|nr:endonuclease domain-containing protein [Alkanindiges illinoisensis]
MNQKIFNRTEYKERRQNLRNNATVAEQQLWQVLRNNQLGVKFRRQHGIGHYITDFYCPALKLVIEVDGDSHFTQAGQQNDQIRDQYFQSLDIAVLRFTNHEVLKNLFGVHWQTQQLIENRNVIHQ